MSENIDAVQKLITHRHVTYCTIKETLGISSISVHKILHDHLAVKKDKHLKNTMAEPNATNIVLAQSISKQMIACFF